MATVRVTKEANDIYELRDIYWSLHETGSFVYGDPTPHVARYSPELHTVYVGGSKAEAKAMLAEDLGHEGGKLVPAQRKHASFPINITFTKIV
mgnify:CR=1 FL=1